MFSGLSGTVDAHTLTEGELAEHVHRANLVVPVSGQGFQGTSSAATGNAATDTDPTGGSQGHAHMFSGHTGNANSLPPYYSVALIMRIS